MKNLKKHIGILGALLFVLVLVFTNDRIREKVPFVNIILLILLLALIVLVIYTFLYISTSNKREEITEDAMSIWNLMILKNKIIKEFEKIENKTTSTVTGRKSIYISIILVLYTFIFIGSSIQTNIFFMQILSGSIRVIAIICGVYFLYINLYMTSLQLKLNTKWIGYLAVLFNFVSILYFGFVSFASVTEILATI